jgi:hypothetical protein
LRAFGASWSLSNASVWLLDSPLRLARGKGLRNLAREGKVGPAGGAARAMRQVTRSSDNYRSEIGQISIVLAALRGRKRRHFATATDLFATEATQENNAFPKR